MTVKDLIEQLAEFGDHLQVALCVPGRDRDRLYEIEQLALSPVCDGEDELIIRIADAPSNP